MKDQSAVLKTQAFSDSGESNSSGPPDFDQVDCIPRVKHVPKVFFSSNAPGSSNICESDITFTVPSKSLPHTTLELNEPLSSIHCSSSPNSSNTSKSGSTSLYTSEEPQHILENKSTRSGNEDIRTNDTNKKLSCSVGEGSYLNICQRHSTMKNICIIIEKKDER